MAESHEVYGVRAPKDTIIVTPQETPQLVYDKSIDGEELLSILIHDARTGPLLVAMSVSMAEVVAEHLRITLTVDNIDRLRADWEQKNGDRHE